MILMERFRWMDLTSRQFKRYILEGGDLAALPVGSMEVMGPHLPVGIKMFIARAIAEEICKIHEGLCLPVVPLSPITGDKEHGGVSLDTNVALSYLRDVVCEAHENAIRRMLLVGSFDEIYYVSAEIFQEYDIPLTHIDPMNLPLFEDMGVHERFNAIAAGSLRLLGEDELLTKMLEASKKCIAKGGYKAPDEAAPIKNLLKVVETDWISGVFPHFYKNDEYKVLPTENICPDSAAEAIRNWILDKEGALDALSKYAGVFPRTRYDRGLRMGGIGFAE